MKLVPQGSVDLILEYYSNIAAMSRKPSLLSSGVFGVPIEVVSKYVTMIGFRVNIKQDCKPKNGSMNFIYPCERKFIMKRMVSLFPCFSLFPECVD